MNGYLIFLGAILLFIAVIALLTGPVKVESHTIHMHQAPHQYERNDRAAAQERGYSYPPPAEQPAQVTVNNRRGRLARQLEGWRETPAQPQPPRYNQRRTAYDNRNRAFAQPRVERYEQPEYDDRWNDDGWGTDTYSQRAADWERERRAVQVPLVDPNTGEVTQAQPMEQAPTPPETEQPPAAGGWGGMSLDMASKQRFELHPRGTPTTGRNTEPPQPRRVVPLELPDDDAPLNYRNR